MMRFTKEERDRIARELCDDAGVGRPGNPVLLRDIGRAEYIAFHSPTFRVAILDRFAPLPPAPKEG